MLIGHLPAGYFLTRTLLKRFKIPLTPLWLGLGLVGSVAPDFDHAINLFFQASITDHRFLLPHIPYFYFLVFLVGLLVYKIKRWLWLKNGMIILLPNMFLHLFLDTFFVGIEWLSPFSHKLFGIYNVNLTGGIIVQNYFQHWYWYLEIALWLLAISHVIFSYKKGEIK